MEKFDLIKMTRRDFMKAASAAGLAAGALAATGIQLIETPKRVKAQVSLVTPASQNQVPVLGSSISKFVDPLPILDITPGGLPNATIQTIVTSIGRTDVEMREFKSKMLPSDFVPQTGTYDGTWVWGYVKAGTPAGVRDTYTGPVVVAARNTPSTFKFTNLLGNGSTTNVLAYKFATDQSLHWANPDNVPMYIANADPGFPWIGNPTHYLSDIPAAVHLHGGEDMAATDGGPESWFTSGGRVGKAFYSEGWDGVTPQNYCIYTYPNVQEAAPLWFHDHTLGATRLNVYMGLAGAYLLIDPTLNLPAGLTAAGVGTDVLIPLVIQDRIFDQDGQLYFPADPMIQLIQLSTRSISSGRPNFLTAIRTPLPPSV